jgi:hypothetical protein
MLSAKNISKSIQIDILVVTILLYLFRTTIPFLKFPFLILFFCIVIYSFIYYRRQFFSIFKEFFLNFQLAIILAVFLIFAFLFSNKLYLTIFKDISNTVILLFLFFLLTFYIKSKEELKLFINELVRIIVVFALLISIRLLFNFIGEDSISSNNSVIGAVSFDNNFALLSVFFGMISIIYSLAATVILYKKVFLNLILIFFSTTVLFSGSRRGLFTLIAIIVIVSLIQLFKHFKKNYTWSLIGNNTSLFRISILILALFLFGYAFMVPVTMKRHTLNALGIDVRSYKKVISSRLYKYSTIFTDQEYNHFQYILWPEKPDPRYPDTGWGSRPSTLLSRLSGENVDIVPKGSVGYKMDKTCDASAWNNNAYSYTNISCLYKDGPLERNEFYHASVYCFVSKDFDGSWAHISTEGEVSGKTIQEYDMSRKGVWQKISITFRNAGNISPVYLYWAKNGVSNFSNLRGSIIFSYPEYTKIRANSLDPETGWGTRISHSVFPLTGKNIEIVPEGSIGYKMDSTCNASTWNSNAYSFTNISSIFNADSTSLRGSYRALVYCYVSDDFDGNWARISAEGAATGKTAMEYDLGRKGTWQKLQIDFKADSETPPVYLYWAKNKINDFSSLKGYIIFAHPEYSTPSTITGFNSNFSKSIKSSDDRNDRFRANMTLEGPESGAEINLCNSGFIFFFPVLNNMLAGDIDTDPVRRLVAKFISEDTTYYAPKKLLTIDTISNKMAGPRLMRWEFAWQIFKGEFNIKQKLFGGGFNFLNWYGYKFVKDKTASDYPHNPFLSILLYSGLIGLLIYLILFCKVIYYNVLYFKEYPIISIFFAITFFFSFFSAGSPFDPPVMGFFILLPFFIHNILYPKSLSNE